MSKSAANAEQIALQLEYAAQAAQQAMEFLNAAVTLADHEDLEYRRKFAELRGDAATLRADVEYEQYDWGTISAARSTSDPELDFSGHA